MRLFRRIRSDERGATAIEYGLVAGIIAVALIGIAATGGAVDTLYSKLLLIVSNLAAAP